VIRRINRGNLGLYEGDAPPESCQLEQQGYAVLRGVFDQAAIDAMTAEIEQVFRDFPPEHSRADKAEFRYEMLNRSAACHAAIAHPRILAAIEPVLGGDCHVIANTAWWNPPTFGGGPWHCDAGPHIPRPEGVEWDERIPYPVFAIGCHLYLRDCPVECGPTAVIPGSHRSGRLAPRDRIFDDTLSYEGHAPVLLTAAAGDVAMFVSDVWHRGTPAGPDGTGRLFLQVHYGRRDIQQRMRLTSEVNHLTPEAIARAEEGGLRARQLVGLHDPFFYDG
jgi:Phytanoyl-CoA dioxygenase (PhyH)